MATEYVRGVVKELGHIDTSGASPADVPWGKTTEDGLAFTPGSVRREQFYNGQDYGPVDSQRTRIEGTSVRFRMAQADPVTIARTLGLPEDAVTGTGPSASLTVQQQDMGAREFHLYAIVETSLGLRRLEIPRAVVADTDELNFTKGQWATPGSTMTVLQKDGEDAFWKWVPEDA